MIGKDFDVGTFLDHLVYRWLRRDFLPGLLYTSQDLMFMRQAMVSGLALPSKALMRTSPPTIDPERYGKSVLKRTVLYNDEPVLAQLIDYTVKYSLFSAAYTAPEVNRDSQVVTDLDNQRYFDFDLSDVIPPSFKTRAEFRKTGHEFKAELSEETQQRKVYIGVDWELRITIPSIESAAFIDRVNIFINNEKIASVGG